MMAEATPQPTPLKAASSAAAAASPNGDVGLDRQQPPGQAATPARSPPVPAKGSGSGLGRFFSKIGLGGESVAPEVSASFLPIPSSFVDASAISVTHGVAKASPRLCPF